jgi:hypothetical protein
MAVQGTASPRLLLLQQQQPPLPLLLLPLQNPSPTWL